MHNEDMQEIRSYNKVVYGDQEIAKEVMKLPWCHRMDIIFVNFGLIENNCLIHKSRPAIVISTTEYNKQSPIMQVIPMSKQLKGLDKKYHVFVDHTDCEKLWESGHGDDRTDADHRPCTDQSSDWKSNGFPFD